MESLRTDEEVILKHDVKEKEESFEHPDEETLQHHVQDGENSSTLIPSSSASENQRDQSTIDSSPNTEASEHDRNKNDTAAKMVSDNIGIITTVIPVPNEDNSRHSSSNTSDTPTKKHVTFDGMVSDRVADDKKPKTSRITLPNGDIYQGEVVAGRRHGTGVSTSKHFSSGYEGSWKDDKRHGFGKYTTSSYVYEGDWYEDKKHGKGKLTQNSGNTYQGDFSFDRMHGLGTWLFPNGSVYKGRFQNNHCDGQGKMVYLNGDIYEGSWKHSKKNGQGATTYINGDIYEGQYKDGKPHGQGCFTYVKKDLYEQYDGQFEQGEYHGSGVYRYCNGDIYDGLWENGLKHGEGEIVYAHTGERSPGVWEFDDCMEEDTSALGCVLS